MRVVGKRQHAQGDRKGLDELVLHFGGGAPKGIFRYRTAEEANRDWDQWTIERARRRTAENVEGCIRALAKLSDGAAKELAGDATVHLEPYAIRINDEFTVDVMNSSASGLTWTELQPYVKRIDGINVVSLEGLLRMKQGGRLEDHADAEAIRKVLGI